MHSMPKEIKYQDIVSWEDLPNFLHRIKMPKPRFFYDFWYDPFQEYNSMMVDLSFIMLEIEANEQ